MILLNRIHSCVEPVSRFDQIDLATARHELSGIASQFAMQNLRFAM